MCCPWLVRDRAVHATKFQVEREPLQLAAYTWHGHPAHTVINTAAVLGGLWEASCMPGCAAGMGKMFYTSHDQLPTVLDELELRLKQAGSQTRRMEWEQRLTAKSMCDTALLWEHSCFCHFPLLLQEQ